MHILSHHTDFEIGKVFQKFINVRIVQREAVPVDVIAALMYQPPRGAVLLIGHVRDVILFNHYINSSLFSRNIFRAVYCNFRAYGIYYGCQQKGDDRMAGTTTNISIRMDTDLKAQADALFSELGMNLTTAFNIFVRQSLREGGIPFEVKLEKPNKETIAAMLEAERIAKDPSVKGYTDLDELFADLKK